MSDRTALAWAACFVAIGVLALLVELDVWRPRIGWVWPVLLMVVGLALLVGGAVGSGRDDHGTPRR